MDRVIFDTESVNRNALASRSRAAAEAPSRGRQSTVSLPTDRKPRSGESETHESSRHSKTRTANQVESRRRMPFTGRLRKRLGPAARDKLIFGEVYDGDPAVLGRYTWRSDWQQDPSPCLDSVLDFQFCFSAREFLRRPGGEFGGPGSLESRIEEPPRRRSRRPAVLQPEPRSGRRNAADKAITFIENHDGLNRFRVDGVSERRNRLAQALVLTSPGIPCLYYGTEMSLHDPDGRIGRDGETGRATLFRSDHDRTWAGVLQSRSLADISRLAALRRELPALRDGRVRPAVGGQRSAGR